MLTRFWLDANARQATEPEMPAISLLQWERGYPAPPEALSVEYSG